MTRAVRFIAEVSSNHHRDLERCLAFVDLAAEIGCDAVKFQLFRVRELFAPEILAASATHRAREAWELPPQWIETLSGRARDRGISFGCTPFDLGAVDELSPHVDFLKVASYELLWEPLLEACARTGRPLVLSTGMATLTEVERAAEVVARAGCSELTLLHCVSGYPTPPAEANLAAIDSLRGLARKLPEVHLEVGWSDHTTEPGVIHRAIHAFGASAIEFHIDLDGRGEEFKTGHCWLPDRMAAVIRDTQLALSADGTGEKRPSPLESEERNWRADPVDGYRPLRSVRRDFRG